MARTVLRDPIRVTVGVRNSSNPNVEQSLVYCGISLYLYDSI